MKRLSIFLGVALIALFIASCSGGNSPKVVAEKSMKCLVDKDFEGYVDLIYFSDKDMESADFQESKKQLAALIKDKGEKSISKKDNIKSFETISEEIAEDGNTANVKMKVVYGNGEEEANDIKMRKDKDGNWKIDMGK